MTALRFAALWKGECVPSVCKTCQVLVRPGAKHRRAEIAMRLVGLVICFVVASGLLAAGLYLLYMEAFVARIISGQAIGIGATLAFVGGAWLWVDFVGPILRGENLG